MKRPITQTFLAVFLCAGLSAGVALTNESSAACSSGGSSQTGTTGCTASAGPFLAQASSSAEKVEYGSVTLTTSAVVEGANGAASVTARAGFSDHFIIYGLPDGTEGILEMLAGVDGSPGLFLQDSIALGGSTFSLDPQESTMRVPLPFRFGDIFDFSAVIDLTSTAISPGCSGCGATNERFASFHLQYFRVLDMHGAELRGYKFHTESETEYEFRGGTFQDPAAVPEPSTYALVGLGLLGVGWNTRRTKPNRA